MRQSDKKGVRAVGGQWVGLVGGMVLGALAMYVADPDMGRRRRAAMQERMRELASRTGDAVNGVMREAGSRASGVQFGASRLLGQQRVMPIDDHVLEARVRSRISRLSTELDHVGVSARLGTVTLRGPVSAVEKSRLLDLVEGIPGVEYVRDRLQDGDSSSSLARMVGDNAATLKLAAGLGVGLLACYAVSRRGSGGMRAAAAGFGMLAGLRNMDWRKYFGSSVSGQPVEIEKQIQIQAMPDAVFDIWSRIENFPQFMSHVLEVRDLGRGRSHWAVRGPAGSDIQWNAQLTEIRRPSRLAWQSEPGAMVENSGSVDLEPRGGGTLATVCIAWSPPAGVLGQSLALLLGSDPERQLEEDLLRMKRFIERGVPQQQDTAPPMTTARQILH
ncbi:MAG: polyketide cyclase [Herminiimonas sp.]|nr:polyketide cyclase [Herminiimonas sp.]